MPADVYMGSEDQPVRGYLMDLSESGAAFITPRPAQVDTGLFLRFRIEPGITCEATGVVVRTHDFGGQCGNGVELTYANQPFLLFLRNLEAVHEAERPTLLADIRGLEAHFG